MCFIQLKSFSCILLDILDVLYKKKIRKNAKNKYSNLQTLKNKHKGERCFIVCTGPSLSITDLEMLKHDYTFGMNNIFRLFDKTSWRPMILHLEILKMFLFRIYSKKCLKGFQLSNIILFQWIIMNCIGVNLLINQ